MHQIRRALFSTITNNITSIEDYAYIDPTILIKIGKKQNSLELFNSVKDRFRLCKYEYAQQYRNLIVYMQRSHQREFINSNSLPFVIANQFSDNIMNSHMIWLSYIIELEQQFNQNLRSLESIWYNNIIYLNIDNIYTILTFYDKIKKPLRIETLNVMLQFTHKQIMHNYNKEKFQQIYQILHLFALQQPILKGDQQYIEIAKKIESQIQESIQKFHLIKYLSLFSIYPIDQLNFFEESLKNQKYQLTSLQMKQLLSILQNYLLTHPNYNNEELILIMNRIEKIFSMNNTFSNKYHFTLLNQINKQENLISKYDSSIDLFQMNDLDFTLQSKKLIKNEDVNQDLQQFIYKFINNTLSKRKLLCSDFDYLARIMEEIQNNKDYSLLVEPIRNHLQEFSFLY